MQLTDNEKRDISKYLKANKPLPEKYRFLLFNDNREVELLWNGKTDEVENIVLPFQTIEHIDVPRSESKINLQGSLLDMAMSGTTATLLARRWESALLVNVDNETLARLMANEEAMRILMSIEGFRSINQDIEIIINKSESVKKAKQAANDKNLTAKEKKTLNSEEKEYKSKRKEIQNKLIKFATRIPVFMYLTDYREKTLRDVITQLEPELFKKVTGLNVKDFELLMSLNIFNNALMNDTVYKFKRYEDSSLEYTGINKHMGKKVGGFDTVISNEEHKIM